jgi:hypothetical protein
MGILTDDMKRVVNEQKLGFIATVCVIFVDIKSPGTVANPRQNPAIEINVVDQLVRKGYRFKGTAEVFADEDLATTPE